MNARHAFVFLMAAPQPPFPSPPAAALKIRPDLRQLCKAPCLTVLCTASHLCLQFLASKVVVFFFSLMDMAHIRHIYQFSLKWFLSLFKDSLHTCPRSNAGAWHLQQKLV